MIEILGYIFAALIAAFVAYLMYHIIKGAVVGASLMRWKMAGYTWEKIRAVEGYKMKLVKQFLGCWGECIGYNGGISYSRGGRKWTGYGTGR